MTDRIDLKGFLSAYLAEADEHLAAASEKTLAIEAALAQGGSNARAVRDLFRILHTVKGLSAMVGIEPIVTIAHRLESILRAADRGSSALTAPSIEVIFEALRAIEQRLRALEQGKEVLAVPAALLARLEAHDGHGTPPSPAEYLLDLDPAVDAKLAGFEREQLVQGIARGQRAVCAEFVPSRKKAAEGLTINSVRERVAKIAEIVKVLPMSAMAMRYASGSLDPALNLRRTAAE